MQRLTRLGAKEAIVLLVIGVAEGGCVPGVEQGFGGSGGGDPAPSGTSTGPRAQAGRAGMGPGSPCEAAISDLTPDQSTPLGFSAAEAQKRVTGAFQGTLSWTAGAIATFADAPAEPTTAMTVEITATGALRLVDERGPSGAPNDRLACGPRRLELGATVRISTADGSFAGMWALTLRIESREVAGFSLALAPADLVGTFRAKPRDMKGFAFKLKLDGDFTGAGELSGIMGFSAERMTGNQGEGFAGPIATFAAKRV